MLGIDWPRPARRLFGKFYTLRLVSASFLFRSVKLILLGSLFWQVSYFVRSFCRYSEAFGFGKLPRSLGKYSEARGFGEFRLSLSNYPKLVRS